MRPISGPAMYQGQGLESVCIIQIVTGGGELIHIVRF